MNSKIILKLFLVAFLSIAIIDLFAKQLSFADSFSTSILICVALYISTKYEVSPLAAICYCLIFVPNVLGHFGAYSWVFLNYHYDWIVHFFAPLFAIVGISSFLKDNKLFPKAITCTTIAFLVAVSAGSAIEISEYWGFYFLGLGSGYLGFGTGDNSSNFGPWENSSVDMTFNIVGSLVGSILFLLIDNYYVLNSGKKHKKTLKRDFNLS